MENKKKAPGIIVGIEIGCICCFVFVRTIVDFTEPSHNILLGILLCLFAWIGLIAAYYSATFINRKMEEKLEPEITQKYSDAFEYSKKENELLNPKNIKSDIKKK